MSNEPIVTYLPGDNVFRVTLPMQNWTTTISADRVDEECARLGKYVNEFERHQVIISLALKGAVFRSTPLIIEHRLPVVKPISPRWLLATLAAVLALALLFGCAPAASDKEQEPVARGAVTTVSSGPRVYAVDDTTRGVVCYVIVSHAGGDVEGSCITYAELPAMGEAGAE